MYNFTMEIPLAALEILLADAVARDRTTARRKILLTILLRERFLNREQLITRVEGQLGYGCFGVLAWEDTFYRDMQVVKRALRSAGYQPAYSRRTYTPGYYLRDQPPISMEISSVLDGSVAEVDLDQIAIFKNLTFEQRFQLGCSISNLACRTVAQRIRQREPQLSLIEAYRIAVQGNL